MSHVTSMLSVLCEFYGKGGTPHELNETQIAMYCDALAEFSRDELAAAAKAHMQRSPFFPKLSELRAILEPEPDYKALAAAAWAHVEQAIKRHGAYVSVQFADPSIGEAVRQTFGSWDRACSFDYDSPGWAIRRQTFMAIFPDAAKHATEPVMLRGLHNDTHPAIVGPLKGLPAPAVMRGLPIANGDEAMSEIRRRVAAFKAQRQLGGQS
jgi:hypothetical protein